ncbi:UNVERIFIED_CONTAM: hypothetical protein HDU68_000020 [Siphonaria sp. JEL0065]|nr:hypothetical protein HDU68_000020 [Siphonaria sp. JEL0065]
MFSQRMKPFEAEYCKTFVVCDPYNSIAYIGDSSLCREVLATRSKEFGKIDYSALNVFGKNIVTTEGKEWRKHRRIAAPAFSEENNLLVHETTISLAERMFSAWQQESIHGPNMLQVDVSNNMTEFALSVFSSAGLGIDIPWHTEADSIAALTNGHKLTFKKSLEIVLEKFFIRLMCPTMLENLPLAVLQNTKSGYQEFDQYLDEIIEDAENDLQLKPKNLLQMLAKSAMEDKVLDRSELKGNAFVFILAGHETTAGALAFALALLAIHKDKQQKLYQEIKSIIEDKDRPDYTDFPKLKYALSVMNETLRLFPPLVSIPKFTGNKTTTLGPFVFPPDTQIRVPVTALHFNPEIWGPDESEFKPERFMVSSLGQKRLGYVPFSDGPRGCLGKKFAQVEFVALLCMVSLRFAWELPGGKTAEEVLDAQTFLTLKPKKPIELVFYPRDSITK